MMVALGWHWVASGRYLDRPGPHHRCQGCVQVLSRWRPDANRGPLFIHGATVLHGADVFHKRALATRLVCVTTVTRSKMTRA